MGWCAAGQAVQLSWGPALSCKWLTPDRQSMLCAGKLPHDLAPHHVGSQYGTGEPERLPQTKSGFWPASLAGFVLSHAPLHASEPRERRKLMPGLGVHIQGR